MKKHVKEWWQRAHEMARAAEQQPDGYKQLVERMASGDFMPGWALISAGKSAIPALIEGLQHPHARVRRGCVDTIDHGGYGADTRCIEALLPLLQDPVPHIRRAVWHTLFCERCANQVKCEVLTPVALDQVALLIELGLNDPNPKLRGQLIDELKHHAADPRAQRALSALYGHTE